MGRGEPVVDGVDVGRGSTARHRVAARDRVTGFKLPSGVSKLHQTLVGARGIGEHDASLQGADT